MEKNLTDKHTFAICAYKESPYLEECIKSLKEQTSESTIIMVTSTPSLFLENMAEKHSISLYINTGDKGIVQDWNFAYSMVNTPYLTIAHQDDLYFPKYTEKVIAKMLASKKPLIAFSDYSELRNGKHVENNQLLKVKKTMLTPLKINSFQNSIFVRRRILSLGSPICCPSVCFAKENLPFPVFTVGFRSNEDWEAWEKLSKLHGQFLYINETLMAHRIHEESETSLIIGDSARTVEDFEMFCKFWPKPIAKSISKVYANGEKSNSI